MLGNEPHLVLFAKGVARYDAITERYSVVVGGAVLVRHGPPIALQMATKQRKWVNAVAFKQAQCAWRGNEFTHGKKDGGGGRRNWSVGRIGHLVAFHFHAVSTDRRGRAGWRFCLVIEAVVEFFVAQNIDINTLWVGRKPDVGHPEED